MKTKVLLIEDNREMRENTAEILDLANYEVTAAANGREGIVLAKTTSPDIIICDIMMPGLDGYEVLHMLGKDPVTSAIPFIFLTAKTEKADMRKGMQLGADDYLTKPFEEMDLLNVIEKRIERSKQFSGGFDRNPNGLDNFLRNAKSLENLRNLSETGKTIRFKKKEIIYREGEHPNKIFFTISGKVKVYKMNNDGKELITDLYKPGDFFGYVPLLEGKAYGDWAAALEDTELSIITREDFLALIMNNRDVSSAFIKMLSNNLAATEEKLLNLAYDTVRRKVAQALLLLHDKYNAKEENFSISFSREDLSKLTGTAKETTIRALSDLKEDGLIGIEGSKITITNLKGLKAIEF